MKSKIYHYQSDHDILMIKDHLYKPEIWLNTACFTFCWKFHQRPAMDVYETLVQWFIDVLNINPDFARINLCPPNIFKPQDFVRDMLDVSIESLKTLTMKDFEIYEKI